MKEEKRIKHIKYSKRKWIAIGGNLHEDVRKFAFENRITIRELTEKALIKAMIKMRK